MSMGPNERALLAKDSYENHTVNEEPVIGGIQYKVIATASDPITGYQGTAYQRVDTGEVVIAHRGTEAKLNDIGVDAGMVLTGLNAQIPDAEAFTKRAMEEAKKTESKYGHPLAITVTGHSLGGTLAEYTAYKFHLHGETFNAYGAAGLMHGVPEGGSQVTNFVRATDVVSASSAHFGEVRVLATAQDIDTLSHAHFHEDGTGFWRNTAKAVDGSAHGIANFVPDAQGHSALDPGNAARYRAHHAMVDRFRDDILTARTVVSAAWEVPRAAYDEGRVIGVAAAERLAVTYTVAREATTQGARVVAHAAEQVAQGAQQTARQIGEGMQQTGHAVAHGTEVLGRQAHLATQSINDGLSHVANTLSHPGAWLNHKPTPSAPPALLDHPAHPGHVMFQQGLHGVQQLNAQHGVAPSERDAHFASALAVSAVAQGLTRIDHVVLSDDASHAFAVQGRLHGGIEGLDQKLARVETLSALHTPLTESGAQWPQAVQQAQQLQLDQQLQRQALMQSTPPQAMGRSH